MAGVLFEYFVAKKGSFLWLLSPNFQLKSMNGAIQNISEHISCNTEHISCNTVHVSCNTVNYVSCNTVNYVSCNIDTTCQLQYLSAAIQYYISCNTAIQYYVNCNTLLCQLQYITMSAIIHVAKSDITLAKVAKFYVRNECSMLSIPSCVPSNHIAHKWDKQYQQKQGDIPNIRNITGKFIETHLDNYSSYDKHDIASLQAAGLHELSSWLSTQAETLNGLRAHTFRLCQACLSASL